MKFEPVITSFLDTDLYKLTMQAAIHRNHPGVSCKFLLTNRTPDKKLNREGYEWLCLQIASLGELKFTEEEIEYLKGKLGYLGSDHFQWLRTVKLRPDKEVTIVPEVTDGMYDLTITAYGDWETVTLYEIPILSLLSEAYFRYVDTKWTINGELVAEYVNGIAKTENLNIVYAQAAHKTKSLSESNCKFSEFGTRRRRSFQVQDAVMRGIVSVPNSTCVGTSNVLFAMRYGLEPVGTIGHEWMMGIGAITGDYTHANKKAMEEYVNTVGHQHAGLALTDTYGTPNYLKQFDEPYVGWYVGVRQDSGNPEEYASTIADWYREKGYNDKVICFSDSLNVEKCKHLKKVCNEIGIGCIFGIGTNLTNDFDTKPLNIVMKLVECGEGHAIKISDNIAKNMGDERTVFRVKKELGYIEKEWDEGDESNRW
ncbi:unnamed protein product [Pichia kudriavzevii]